MDKLATNLNYSNRYGRKMTDTDIKNLLSPEEIAALLRNGITDSPASITRVLNAEEKHGKETGIAAAINQALLREYLIDSNIVFCGYSRPSPDVQGLQAKLNLESNFGYIIFSAGFAQNIIGRILGRIKTKPAINNISPAATAIMQEVANIICRSAALPAGSPSIPDCSQLTDTDFTDISDNCVPLCFASNEEKMWLLLPEKKLPATENSPEKKQALENTAQELPLDARAVIKRHKTTLRQLSRWHIGDFLPLGIEKNAEISILCGNKTVLKGILGQKLHRIAVKITKKVPLK